MHDEWNTRVDTRTDSKGTATFRGFYGQYTITVKVGDGKPQSFDAALSKDKDNRWTFTVGG